MNVPVLTARMNAFVPSDNFPSSDARPSRRAQKAAGENQVPSRPTVISQLEKPKVTANAESIVAARLRSGVRDYKAPLGPRPAEFSSKRVTSDASSLLPFSASRPILPTATSEPFLGLSARRNTSNFEFRPNATSRENTVIARNAPLHSREEMNSALVRAVSYVDGVNASSRPRGITTQSTQEERVVPRKSIVSSQQETKQVTSVGAAAYARGLETSSVRPKNQALRAAQISITSASGTPMVASSSTKTRRQSHFTAPAALADPALRQPRKSIGPGLVLTGISEKPRLKDALNSTGYSYSADAGPTDADNVSNARLKNYTVSRSSPTSSRHDWVYSSNSTPKAHPLQAANGLVSNQSSTSSMSRDVEIPTTSVKNRSRNRPAIPQSTFSSSSGARRQSGVAFAGGLGARTVSPTDARRLKRMSHAALQPAVTNRSPTPELTFGEREEIFYSPPLVREKSITPSSSRTTPDGVRRAGSVRPLSSHSSYSSLRPLSSSLQRRPSIGSVTSKNSATKSRNVHSAAGGEEEIVPPVPAIPKAYESPQEALERPLFSDAMKSIPALAGYADKVSTPKAEVHGAVPPQSHLDWRQSRDNRGMIMGIDSNFVQDGMQLQSKQSSQPLRLPPMNMLPLSTPTTSRIASFSQFSSQLLDGKLTPPPRRGNTRTPSTPMTASKATFSPTELQCPGGGTFFEQLRSRTSHGDVKPHSPTPATFRESPPGYATPIRRASTWQHSPATISLAAPKSNVDVKPVQHEEGLVAPIVTQPEADRSQPASPRTKAKPKVIMTSGSSQSAVLNGNDTAPPAPSLRRKLSLGWRRSSSKASNAQQLNDDDSPARTSQSEDVPTPRLPSGGNWLSSNMFSSGVSSQAPKGKPSSLRKLSSDVPHKNDFGLVTSTRNGVQTNDRTTTSHQPVTVSVPRTTSSIFNPMHKMLNSRSSQKTLAVHAVDPKLDRDDLAAEDEMKQLAHKQKEVEAAAKALDALTRRATAKERVTPHQASKVANLNIFERGEIIDYEDVYFCGTRNAKKYTGDLASASMNFGFDDERGDYNIVVGDHLGYRYEVIDMLGKGSFGQVVRCIDHKTGKLVAVKIIRNKKRFHQQALVEVNILQRLREWDPNNEHSMVMFIQSFYFRGHLCISTELLGANLYEFIKTHDFRGFSLKLIRRFTKQLLCSLRLLQSHNVIHCDLKPENILLSHPLRSEIKVIDFGSSCLENEKVYTYIQSRFYRSPEVILGMTYGMPIDMWSLGCILAELLTGFPLFPGENEQEQLACIMEVFGPPEKHFIERSTRKKLFFDSLGKPRITVSSKGKRRRPSSKTLNQALKCDDEAFVDFIARCLRWDPDRRMKPDEAIAHEFITGVKKGSRLRSQNTNVPSSPAKRSVPVQTPSRTRPLPEPPATSYGTVVSNRRMPSNSPVKGFIGTTRRHSTMLETQPLLGLKRDLNGPTVGSAVPQRMTLGQRSFSGKPDLASAAAIASLAQRQR